MKNGVGSRNFWNKIQVLICVIKNNLWLDKLEIEKYTKILLKKNEELCKENMRIAPVSRIKLKNLDQKKWYILTSIAH